MLGVAGGRVIAIAQTGPVYVLEPGADAFTAAGVSVPVAKSIVSLADGRAAIVSIGQPNKLYLFDPANKTLSMPRPLLELGGESVVQACRGGMLATLGQVSSDQGQTWQYPLGTAFANLFKHNKWRQRVTCDGDRVFVSHTLLGFDRNGGVFEVAANGSISVPGDVTVESDISSEIGRTGVWHAYPYENQTIHMSSRDKGATWIEGSATHDGKPGNNTGSIRATFFAGAGDEIWSVSGDEKLLVASAGIRIDFDLLRSPNGGDFTLMAESTWEQQLVLNDTVIFGKRMDVVGVTPTSTVVTKQQISRDGRTLQDLPLEKNEEAYAVFEDGKLLTQKITNTSKGNLISMRIRDLGGLGDTEFVPVVDGKTFSNPARIIGVDPQRRIWIHCGQDICRSPAQP